MQESLGGNSKTCLIITCSPSSFNAEETLSTCRFGARAKNIKNKAVVNRELSIPELKLRIKYLEQELEKKNLKLIMCETPKVHKRQSSLCESLSLKDLDIFPSRNSLIIENDSAMNISIDSDRSMINELSMDLINQDKLSKTCTSTDFINTGNVSKNFCKIFGELQLEITNRDQKINSLELEINYLKKKITSMSNILKEALGININGCFLGQQNKENILKKINLMKNSEDSDLEISSIQSFEKTQSTIDELVTEFEDNMKTISKQFSNEEKAIQEKSNHLMNWQKDVRSWCNKIIENYNIKFSKLKQEYELVL